MAASGAGERRGSAASYPRIAGVSSFGAGGANAHVVIEEYVPRAEAARPSVAVKALRPALVVLSAKNEERLKAQAGAAAGRDRAARAWRRGSCRCRLHAAGRARGDGVPAWPDRGVDGGDWCRS